MKQTSFTVKNLEGNLSEKQSTIIKRCFRSSTKPLSLENAKVEKVSTKKLDDVLSQQKPFFDKSGLGYTGESNSAANLSKEVKFVKTKELMVAAKNAEKVKPEKKNNVTDQRFMTKPPKQSVVKPKRNGKSLPKSQRGLRTQYFCHHYGIQVHTRPNCYKLQALKNSSA